jgi:DNA-binding transcriptional ArsR family regulator
LTVLTLAGINYSMVVYDDLARTFAALSDPTRLRILARLVEEPATCKDLETPFDISQQAVSKHIGVLRDAGLLRQRNEGRSRVCEVVPGALEEVVGWIDQHRALWAGRFDQLDAYLEAKKRAGTRNG